MTKQQRGSSAKAASHASTVARRSPGKREALTPLARVLRRPQQRATPQDLLALANRKWADGERLDIGQLARELGVARATVFRWVGSRELLYGEVLSQAYVRERGRILKKARGRGIERLVQISRFTMNALYGATPLRKFIEQDPEFAIRVLASKQSPVQARSIELEKVLLREILAEEKLKPSLDLDTLAFLIVRIGESFLYADVISGRKPEIEKAVAAIRILVSAEKSRAR